MYKNFQSRAYRDTKQCVDKLSGLSAFRTTIRNVVGFRIVGNECIIFFIFFSPHSYSVAELKAAVCVKLQTSGDNWSINLTLPIVFFKRIDREFSFQVCPLILICQENMQCKTSLQQLCLDGFCE